MKAWDLSKWHPECPVQVGETRIYCPKHRVIADLETVGLRIDSASSYLDPAQYTFVGGNEKIQGILKEQGK